MLPPAGTYPNARLTEGQRIVIYEAMSGALCAAIPVALVGDEWTWNGKHTITLANKDGAINSRNVDTLKKVFAWDGQDPFWLADQDFAEVTFDVVGEHEAYTPEGSDESKQVFKIKWLNPPGEGGGAKMPEPADRKIVLAKYGSKFRALSGVGAKPASTPAKAKEPVKQAELPTQPKKAPAGPPAAKKTESKPVPESNMDDAWAALNKARPGQEESALSEFWFAEIARMFPGKNNSDLTPQEWGTLKASFEAVVA